MRSNFLTTVYGPATPGIVKALSKFTRQIGGEWLTSKIIKLDGQFAAIFNVVIEQQMEKTLKNALEIHFPDLHFAYSQAVTTSVLKQTKIIKLLVECIDRPGLTGDLSSILSNLEIAIEHMECKRFIMDSINEQVFSARLTVAIPIDAEDNVIIGEIEALSEDVQVSIHQE